jgi:hypothetical protein
MRSTTGVPFTVLLSTTARVFTVSSCLLTRFTYCMLYTTIVNSTTGVAEHGLHLKAAALMGDKGLERRALDAVGDHAQLNKKASHSC